jgi:hypothetical protein
MANRNFASGGKIYSMHVKPVLLDCNFIVDSTNGNGLGIRSLKGPMIQNVFMHTSASPGAGNSNPASPNVVVTNPNPASGTIIVQLQDNYNRSFSGFNAIVSPVSGSPLLVASAGLTVGVAYIIVTLGTTTTAAWHALGVPAGVAPAVGVAFIAKATSALGTGAVEITAAAGSGVASIETVGDPNLSIAPDPTVSQGFGAQLILQCRDYAGAIVAPANGSVISISMYLSDSSVIIQGE